MSEEKQSPLLDPEHPEHEEFMSMIDLAVRPPNSASFKTLHDLEELSVKCESLIPLLEDGDLTSKDILKVSSGISDISATVEALLRENFERAVIFSAPHFPDIEPPFIGSETGILMF